MDGQCLQIQIINCLEQLWRWLEYGCFTPTRHFKMPNQTRHFVKTGKLLESLMAWTGETLLGSRIASRGNLPP